MLKSYVTEGSNEISESGEGRHKTFHVTGDSGIVVDTVRPKTGFRKVY